MAEPDIIMLRLREIREAKGWTRYRLAKEAGVVFNTLKNAEEGRKSPNLDTVRKICDALGVELSDVARKEGIAAAARNRAGKEDTPE